MPLALLGVPRHWIAFELRAAAGQYGVTVACEPYVTLDASGIKQLEAVSSEHELACKPVSSFYDHVFAMLRPIWQPRLAPMPGCAAALSVHTVS